MEARGQTLRMRIENGEDAPIVPAPTALETQAQTSGAHRIPLLPFVKPHEDLASSGAAVAQSPPLLVR